MPIKNFLKIFTSKFSMVYAILLYLIVILLIIASVSVFAIIPVYRFLDEKGVFIESVSPRTQVFIEGILIHGPNRLRSGDRVTIAHSIFCLRF